MINPYQFETMFHGFRHTVEWTQIELHSSEVRADGETIDKSADDEDYEEYLVSDCRASVVNLIRLLMATAEGLKLRSLIPEIAGMRDRYDKDDLDLGIIMNRHREPFRLKFIDECESIAELLRRFLSPSAPSWQIGAESVLNELLNNTREIVTGAGVKVGTEPHIVSEVYRIARLCFPDAQPDRSVKFKVKNGFYTPDMAFPALGLCVEYKLAATETELKSEFDQLINDMANYGDAIYERFIGVMCINIDMPLTDGEIYAEMERRAAALPKKVEKWSFKLIRIPVQRKLKRVQASSENASVET